MCKDQFIPVPLSIYSIYVICRVWKKPLSSCPEEVDIWFGRVILWHDLSKGQAHFSLPTNKKTKTLIKLAQVNCQDNICPFMKKWRFLIIIYLTKVGWTVKQISTLWSHALFMNVTSMCEHFFNLHVIFHLVSYVEVFCSLLYSFGSFLGVPFVLISQLAAIVFV